MAAPFVFWRLGEVAFDDPGEGMHAEIARELAGSRDPLRLTLNGVAYADKPPLLYALVVAAWKLGGRGEGVARSVSALAAIAGVAATGWAGARLLGPRAGIIAGLALLSCPGFFAYARYLRPDALFVAALAAGWALALVGLAEERDAMLAAGVAVFGIAALAKDPLGLLAPPLALAAALAICGQARRLARPLLGLGLLAALVIGVGWWVAAAIATPGSGWYAVVDNHVLNVVRARRFPDADVPLGATEFVVVALAGALPWAIVAALAVVRLWQRRAWREPAEVPWIASALWALGVLVTSTLSAFRLPHYGLPAYPAIALLAARSFGDVRARMPVRAIIGGFAAVAVACLLVIGLGGTRFDSVFTATDVATRKTALTGAASPVPGWEVFEPLVRTTGLLCLAGAIALVSVGRRSRAAAAVASVVTALAILPCVGAGLAAVSAHRSVKSLARALDRQAGVGDVVALEGPIEDAGALEWYSGRRPVIVDGLRSVLAFGASRPEAPDVFWDAGRLRAAWQGPARVWLVSGRPPERSVVGSVPRPRLVLVTGGRRLYVNR